MRSELTKWQYLEGITAKKKKKHKENSKENMSRATNKIIEFYNKTFIFCFLEIQKKHTIHKGTIQKVVRK